ncbi:universal stress protein [Desulfogranum mediterraneum]|uniref:universal stress protein n=1 Tax=Desulfogranum mediterraneum TaxID=160661 RepID=UPI000414008C|nr:universal stress protein [Desulfogranum mediterraneum]
MEKKVLVAIDGSVYSSNSLDYLIKIFARDSDFHVHLLSIVAAGGSSQDWMFDVDPLRQQSPAAEKRSRTAHRYLKDARERLARNGFAKEQISFSSTTTSSGVAAAIHQHATQGHYDGVLIGRRGVGTVGGMFLGSTSSELLQKCHEIPLWIIDGEVASQRFLLAVQSQPESLMAADHLAYMLKDHNGAEICLYHSNSMFGRQAPAAAETFHDRWGQQWCEQYLDLENFLFYAHAQVLRDHGFPGQRISQLPAQMHLDVGFDLLRQAKRYNCGTVVIGRRGRQSTKGLFKGVSDRTVQQASNIATWLVG